MTYALTVRYPAIHILDFRDERNFYFECVRGGGLWLLNTGVCMWWGVSVIKYRSVYVVGCFGY